MRDGVKQAFDLNMESVAGLLRVSECHERFQLTVMSLLYPDTSFIAFSTHCAKLKRGRLALIVGTLAPPLPLGCALTGEVDELGVVTVMVMTASRR